MWAWVGGSVSVLVCGYVCVGVGVGMFVSECMLWGCDGVSLSVGEYMGMV